MIQTRIINEINQSLFEITNMEEQAANDFRLKMLEENKLPCFLNKTVRVIDGVSNDYYDITGKESIISFFNLRVADRNELGKLFKAMAEASAEAEKLLIEEGNIMFRPDCIFIDSKTLNYEFICFPVEESENAGAEYLASLMQFFLSKLDDNDIELLKTVYSMFDKAQSSGITSVALYELFLEGINKNQNDRIVVPKHKKSSEEKPEENLKKNHVRYVPSFRGVAAISLAAVGLALIGYHTYIMML